MHEVVLGIGDLDASNDPSKVLKTYALGSCIAIVLYDRSSQTGGMVHIALSDSKVNEEKSKTKPGYFVDTAIPVLLKKMQKLSPQIDVKKVAVKLIGGASILKEGNFFNIGENNIISAKQLLKHFGLPMPQEDTGSDISRTVTLYLDTGKTIVSNAEKGKWEL